MQNKKMIRGAKYFRLAPYQTNLSNNPSRIAISLQDRIVIIEVNDILYLKAESNYTQIFLKDGTELLASKTLKSFQAKIQSKQPFIRVHQSYLVRSNAICTFNTAKNIIELKNGAEISVSRSSKKAVLAYIKTFQI